MMASDKLISSNDAITCINTVLNSQYNYKMRQTKLAKDIAWSTTFYSLGKFQDFLEEHSNLFHIEITTPGLNVVSSIAVGTVFGVANAAFPVDGIYRPFDTNDKICSEKDHRNKREFIKGHVINALLLDYDETSALQCFDGAYAKCARLSMSISYVPDYPDVTENSIRELLEQSIHMVNSSRLYVTAKRSSQYDKFYFQAVSVTIGGSDLRSCEEVRLSLRNALYDRKIVLKKYKKTFSLFAECCSPKEEAVMETVRDLLLQHELKKRNEYLTRMNHDMNQEWRDEKRDMNQNWRKPQQVLKPQSQPDQNAQFHQTAQEEAIVAVNGEDASLPLAETIWPVEFEYVDPNKCIISDPNEDSELAKFIADANKEMKEKEAKLRERCDKLRNNNDGKVKWNCDRNCEWICEFEFQLGQGYEAIVYMGLYADPANPDKESVLVAIKQSHPGSSPFNSQESQLYQDHLKRRSGIAQYHTNFDLTSQLGTSRVLVQDIGLLSLEDLRKRKVKMTAEQKFKLSKAMCMIVENLHTYVVHRDLRLENVLLMRDGSVCITDFGLARTAEAKGRAHNNTKQTQTIMQPFEVQTVYDDDDDDSEQDEMRSIPITRSGDVFMLGLMLAYIHQGKLPFKKNSDQIQKKNEPSLDVSLETEQPWLFHLIRSMLNHDMKQRPEMKYVLKHPYFLGHMKNNELLLSYALTVCGDTGDEKPRDNPTFRALETVLSPLELELKSQQKKWHEKYEGLFKKHKVPFASKRLEFNTVEDAVAREYPLPELAQLLKFLRNTLSHAGPESKNILRRSKREVTGDETSFYATFGDFFTTHPAVAWLLPAVWMVTVKIVARNEQDRADLFQEDEIRHKQYETDDKVLQDKLKDIERVLEWNR
jgi:serine/threonine protein kinase